MLNLDQSEDICFALVAGLGTLLKGFVQTGTEDEIILVATEDEGFERIDPHSRECVSDAALPDCILHQDRNLGQSRQSEEAVWSRACDS